MKAKIVTDFSFSFAQSEKIVKKTTIRDFQYFKSMVFY